MDVSLPSNTLGLVTLNESAFSTLVGSIRWFLWFAFGARLFLIRIAFGALVPIAFGARSLLAFGAGMW